MYKWCEILEHSATYSFRIRNRWTQFYSTIRIQSFNFTQSYLFNNSILFYHTYSIIPFYSYGISHMNRNLYFCYVCLKNIRFLSCHLLYFRISPFYIFLSLKNPVNDANCLELYFLKIGKYKLLNMLW